MSTDKDQPHDPSFAETQALARIRAVDLTPDAGVPLDPEDKWADMSDGVLHVHAVTEEKLRPAAEAGELPPDLTWADGRQVAGVHFKDYQGAGRAWQERVRTKFLVHGPIPGEGEYVLGESDKEAIARHIGKTMCANMLDQIAAKQEKLDQELREAGPSHVRHAQIKFFRNWKQWLSDPAHAELIDRAATKSFTHQLELQAKKETPLTVQELRDVLGHTAKDLCQTFWLSPDFNKTMPQDDHGYAGAFLLERALRPIPARIEEELELLKAPAPSSDRGGR